MPAEELPTTAVLDTNVLLLWLAFQVDVSLFKTWKRVQIFETPDAQSLSSILHPFMNIATTPHVLAETSNFVDQAPAYRRTDLIAAFKQFVSKSDEHHDSATLLTTLDEFPILGLTDAGLTFLSRKTVVITTDFHLSGRITSLNGYTINLNHLRGKRLLS